MKPEAQYYKLEPISVKPEKTHSYHTIAIKPDYTRTGAAKFLAEDPVGESLWTKGWNHLDEDATHWLKPLNPEEGVWMSHDQITELEMNAFRKGNLTPYPFTKGVCHFCKNAVNNLAGNPALWAVQLPIYNRQEDKNEQKLFHIECIKNAMNL